MKKVVIKQNCKLWINGEEFSFNTGTYELEEDKARILIEAGYATEVEDQKPRRKKDDNTN